MMIAALGTLPCRRPTRRVNMSVSLNLCKQRILGSSSTVRFAVLISLILVSMAVTREVAKAADRNHRQQFRGEARSTSRNVSVPPGRCNDQPGQAPVIGVAEIQGAG